MIFIIFKYLCTSYAYVIIESGLIVQKIQLV